MFPEQRSDLTVSRRALLALVPAGALAAVLWPEWAEAQTPPPGQTPATIEQPPPAVNVEEIPDAAPLPEASPPDDDSFSSLVAKFVYPVSALAGAGSLTLAVVQLRHQRNIQAAEEARLAEEARSQQLRDISDLLHSSEEADRNKGAERLLMTMARSPSLEDQLQVFQLARDALSRRTLPEEGPIRLGSYERSLIRAFFKVLPAIRESQEMHEPAFAGPDEEMEPNIDAEGIILAGAKLYGQDLRNMHMSRGNFRDTRFNNCTLGPTNFNGCDMRGAMFMHQSKTPTDWDQVFFQNADLRGAFLRSSYLDKSPDLHKNLARRAAIEGLILLGDTEISAAQLKVLTDRGAKYIPKDHSEYKKYYDLTRTPKPPSLDNKRRSVIERLREMSGIFAE